VIQFKDDKAKLAVRQGRKAAGLSLIPQAFVLKKDSRVVMFIFLQSLVKV
jgi:hypothetical protein